MRGLRKYLTPFAPDQSGAESVLYELGGVVVILDAGGCAGNICGFDEPRWSETRSAVFSAGLRDMDAVMGRDRLLVKKITDCVTKIDAKFVAIIGTPVPAVIGTDLQAVKRMLEKQIDLPVVTVATDGMHLCDRGVTLAYQALLKEMDVRGFRDIGGAQERMPDKLSGAEQAAARMDCGAEKTAARMDCGAEKTVAGMDCGAEKAAARMDCGAEKTAEGIAGAATSGTCDCRRVGVFGVTPLDLPDSGSAGIIREALRSEGYEKVILYGSGAALEDYADAGRNTINIAASVDGIAAVKFLQKKFGTPCQIRFPGAENLLPGAEKGAERFLIVHGQVLGNSLRESILGNSLRKAVLRDEPEAQVTVASWFGMDDEIRQPQDAFLKEEDDFIELVAKIQPDVIIGDQVMRRMIPGYPGKFIHLPQFSVSGKREAGMQL